jgi:hypothetical protein
VSERIVVRLGRDGRVEAHTEGVRGPGCLPAIGLLEELLEAVAVESRYTRDYYAAAEVDVPAEQVLHEGETP